MSVYVDDLTTYAHKGYTRWAHMWADTREELLVMADKIGLKREWLQDMPHHIINPHYDLSASKRALALQNGAVYMPAREWLQQHKAAVEP